MVGAKIESMAAGEAVCTLETGEHHFNAGNIVQGGATFPLADFAFAVAANYGDLAENKKNITVSHSANIIFFKPAAGTKLIAKSSCVQKGNKLSTYRVTVTDNAQTPIAELTVTAYTLDTGRRREDARGAAPNPASL